MTMVLHLEVIVPDPCGPVANREEVLWKGRMALEGVDGAMVTGVDCSDAIAAKTSRHIWEERFKSPDLGLLDLRLQSKTVPCSVPTRKLVGPAWTS